MEGEGALSMPPLNLLSHLKKAKSQWERDKIKARTCFKDKLQLVLKPLDRIPHEVIR